MITTYYAAVMSWSFNYLWDAFTLAWGENTSDYFFKNTLGLTSGPFEFGGIKLSMLIGLVLTWVSIIACIWKGPETVGKVVYATVIIPWIILIVLVVRGITLDGAGIGLAYYLNPSFAKLLNGKVWLAAYTQVFFSMSIGFAIMIYFMNFFGLALACLIECVVIGWIFSTTKVIDHVNALPGFNIGKVWEVMIKFFTRLDLDQIFLFLDGH